MSRLELTDSEQDMLVKMAEGNPGAIRAMIALMEKEAEIDPQASFAPLMGIFSLDSHEIYGTDIYILFKDQCNRDVRCFVMLLRAVQLGFFSEARLQEIAGDQTGSNLLSEEELTTLDEKVCERLEEFQRKQVTT